MLSKSSTNERVLETVSYYGNVETLGWGSLKQTNQFQSDKFVTEYIVPTLNEYYTIDIFKGDIRQDDEIDPETKATYRYVKRSNPNNEVLSKLLNIAQAKYNGISEVSFKNAGGGKRIQKSFEYLWVYDGEVELINDLFHIDVVTSEPMPKPVTYKAIISSDGGGGGRILSADGTTIGTLSMSSITKNDLFSRFRNYLTDTNYRKPSDSVEYQTIIIQIERMDIGRIQGIYTFIVKYGQPYNITTIYSIDVHDTGAQISFYNTELRIGLYMDVQPQPIFLQGIADLAQEELIRFTDNLISTITKN
jgi:hypothetical protein